MKTIFIFLALTGLLPAAEWTAWQWEAPFAIDEAGMVRLAVPPGILDVSRPDMGDLRVISPGGVETPFLMVSPVIREGGVSDGRDFRSSLSGDLTVIGVSSGSGGVVNGVELVSPARKFIKSVSIEGRNGGEWKKLAENQVVFRQAGGAGRMRVSIPAGIWPEIRVTVDDGRSAPIPITGLRLVSRGEMSETVESAVELGERVEQRGETRLTLDLGVANLDVAELQLRIPDAVFSRDCSIAYSTPVRGGGSRLETIGKASLFRVPGDPSGVAEELAVPIHRRIPTRYLVAVFQNGDSPPLSVNGGVLRVFPTIMAFHAGSPGNWKLVAGNRAAAMPDYRLGALREALTQARGGLITPGPMTATADYQAPAVLPGVDAAGAEIDLSKWSRRRPIGASAGVIRIELDARTLAACRTDLGDLRLVRNGRQIPYLVRPDPVLRELRPVDVVEVPDKNRPGQSRWRITLPLDDVPMVDLSASSPATLFTRRFVAVMERQDNFGNEWAEQVGTADWIKSPGEDSRLHLDLGRHRMARTFLLETDNGENPPITLDDVVLRYAAPSIMAKLDEGAEVFLYYGNPEAAAPSYDLRLVRNELLAADPQVVSPGAEEILMPDRRLARGVDAGSPWLWLALAGVVVVLLAIVAKMLPKSAEA